LIIIIIIYVLFTVQFICGRMYLFFKTPTCDIINVNSKTMYPEFAVFKSVILLLGGSVQCDTNISEMTLSYNIQLGTQLYHSWRPVKWWNVYHLGFAFSFHEDLVLTRGFRPHREYAAHVWRQLTWHPTHDLGRQLLFKLQQHTYCPHNTNI